MTSFLRFSKYIFIFIFVVRLSLQLGHANQGFNFLNLKDGMDSAVTNPYSGQNNLYEQIFNELNHEYEHIGKLQSQNILNNKLNVTGGLNSIGFTYQRPFVDFSLSLGRVVAPEFNSNNWIVTDTFTIHIDASKILTKLSNSNAIDISKQNLALFAGLVFERKFVWYHVAKTYEEGLSTHFEKLFFPFLGIKLNSIQKMHPNEIITKEDSLTVSAGGFVSAPIYPGITGLGGILGKFKKVARMEMTRQTDTEGIDGYRDDLMLSFEKTKIGNAGVSLQIQGDFLKILRMTLLSYEFDYQLDKSYKINTRIGMNDILHLDENDPVYQEMQKIINIKEPNIEKIAPYILSEENKTSQTISHRYNFLLLGGSKNAKTEQVELVKDGIQKTFFRHYFEKIKYTEDLLSRLISSFIFAVFNSNPKALNLVSETKKVTIEYKSTKNLLEAHEDLNIDSNENEVHNSQSLTLSFNGNYMTKRTKGLFGKKYKERAKFILENYSGVDPLALSFIERDYLVAPYEVEGTYQVSTDGIRQFNQWSTNYVFDQFEGVCSDRPKNIFTDLMMSLFDTCRRSLQNNYIDYLKDLSHEKITEELINKCEKGARKFFLFPSKKRAYIKKCLEHLTYKEGQNWVQIPLWQLKNITQDLANTIQNKVYYYNLFGVKNVFFFGSFEAKKEDGSDFVTYFNEGSFKGLGVVDNELRASSLRSPASIILNQ